MANYLKATKLVEKIRMARPTMTRNFSDEDVYNWAINNYTASELTGVEGMQYEPWTDPQRDENIKKIQKAHTPLSLKNFKLQNESENNTGPSFEQINEEATVWNAAGWLGNELEYENLKYAGMQGLDDAVHMYEHGHSQYQLYRTDEQGKKIPITADQYARDLSVFEDVGYWILAQGNYVDAPLWAVTSWLQKGAGIAGHVVLGAEGTKQAGKFVMERAVLPMLGKTGQVLKKTKPVPHSAPMFFKNSTGLQWLKDNYAENAIHAANWALKTKFGKTAIGREATEIAVNTALKAPASALGIGWFSGAGATINSLREQRMSKVNDEGIGIGPVSFQSASWEGAKGFFEGALLGTAVGATQSAFMKPFGKAAARLEKSNLPFKDALARITRGPLKFGTALSAEAAVFASTPYLWHGTPKDDDGTVRWFGPKKYNKDGSITTSVAYDVLHSGAVISGLKLMMGPRGFIREAFGTEVQTDVYNFQKGKKSKNQKTIDEITERLSNELSPQDRESVIRDFKEQLKDLTDTDLKALEGKKGAEDVLKYAEETGLIDKLLNNKITDADIRNMSSSEQQQLVDLSVVMKAISNHYRKLIKNDTKLDNFTDNTLKRLWKKNPKNKGKMDWTEAERLNAREQFKTDIERYYKRVDKHSTDIVTKLGKQTAVREKAIKAEKEALSEIDTQIKELTDTTKQKSLAKRLKEATDKLKDKDTVDIDEIQQIRKAISKELAKRTPKEKIDDLKVKLRALLAKSTKGEKGRSPAEINKLIKDTEVKGNEAATAKALKLLYEEYRKKDTGDTIPGERLSAEDFKKTTKDETSAQVRKRINDLAKKQKEIENEKPFKDTKDAENHQSNIEIIKHFIQNVWPRKKGTAGASKGSYIKDYLARTGQLVKFSKFLTERGFTFRNFDNDVLREYLGKNSGHATVINELLDFTYRMKLNSQVTLSKSDVKAAASKEVAEVIPGLQASGGVNETNIVSTGKASGNRLQYRTSKQAAHEGANKPISKRLAELLTALDAKAKKIKSDLLFLTTGNVPLTNKGLHGFVNTFFGKKTEFARSFRNSITSWASEKKLSADDKSIIMTEILRERTPGKLEKAYDKFQLTDRAEKILKRFLADIKGKKKGTTSDEYFTPQEIAKGLELILKSGKEVKFKSTDGKDITLDKTTAEALARYLIETSPRINEIVPEVVPKKSPVQQHSIPGTGKKPKPETTTEKAKAEKIRKKYENLDIEVERNQKELLGDNGKPLPKTTWGAVKDGIAKIRAGASVETVVHEMFHPVFDALRAMSNYAKTKPGKDALGLVKQMQKIVSMNPKMRAEYNKLRKLHMKGDPTQGITPKSAKEAKFLAIGEVWTKMIGEYVGGRIMDKSTYMRVKDWINKTYVTLKSKFKSVDKLTPEEITLLMGEKFMKGIPVIAMDKYIGKDKMQYMSSKSGDIEVSARILTDKINNFAKKFGFEYDKVVELLQTQADLIGVDIGMMSDRQIRAMDRKLLTMDVSNLKVQKSDILDLYKDIDTIEGTKTRQGLRDKTDFGKEEQSQWLKSRGVESGNLIDAPKWVRTEYKSVLIQNQTSKAFDIKAGDIIQAGENNPQLKKYINKVFAGGARNWLIRYGMSLQRIAEKLGMKNLGSWNLKHMQAELGHVGPFIAFINGGASLMMGNPVAWRRMRKVFGLFEANEKGAFIRLNDKTASPKAVARAKEIIKKGFKVKVDKNGKWYSDGINWNPNTKKGTLEGKLFYYVKHSLFGDLKRNFELIAGVKFTKARYEKFIKENGIKWLNKGNKSFYIPRRMTREFGKDFSASGFDKYSKEILRRTREIQVEMAEEKYGDKFTKATKAKKLKMSQEMEEHASAEAQVEFATHASFGKEKVTLKNLLKRSRFKMNETYKNSKGKDIQVWEMDAEAVMMPYAAGWGKLLANMEHAPWAVGLKGYMKSTDMTNTIKEATNYLLQGEKGRDIRNLMDTLIQRRVGTFSENVYNAGWNQWSRQYSAGLMRLQLGGFMPPETGIKNWRKQVVEMMHSFRFRDLAFQSLKAFKFKEMLLTEQKGVGQTTGIAGFRPKGTWMNTITGVGFQAGGQPISEIYNKTWARLTAVVDFSREVGHLHTLPETSRLHKKARARLSEWYQLTNEQIKSLIEHGLEPNYNKLSKTDAQLTKMELDAIQGQIELVGILRTAGSTVPEMVPQWASSSWIKPWLMYKRIAFSSFENNEKTMRYNVKNGHWMRTGMMIGGSYVNGAIRLGLLKAFLGQTFPDENTEGYGRVWTTLWGGEFLGSLGDILFSPYTGAFRGDNFKNYFTINQSPLMQTALGGHLAAFIQAAFSTASWSAQKMDFDGLARMLDNGMTPSVAVDKFLRSTSAAYTQTYKRINLKKNKFNGDTQAIRSWKRDYFKETGKIYAQQPTDTQAAKYFDNMRIAFYARANLWSSVKQTFTGTDFIDELNEAAVLGFFAYASDAMRRSALNEKTALKQAEKMIETTLKKMHPLRGNIDGDDTKILTENEEFVSDLNRKWDNDVAALASKKFGIKYEKAGKQQKIKMEEEFRAQPNKYKNMLSTIINAQMSYDKAYKEFEKQFPAYLKSIHVDEFTKYFEFKYRPETQRVIDYLQKKKSAK